MSIEKECEDIDKKISVLYSTIEEGQVFIDKRPDKFGRRFNNEITITKIIQPVSKYGSNQMKVSVVYNKDKNKTKPHKEYVFSLVSIAKNFILKEEYIEQKQRNGIQKHNNRFENIITEE